MMSKKAAPGSEALALRLSLCEYLKKIAVELKPDEEDGEETPRQVAYREVSDALLAIEDSVDNQESMRALASVPPYTRTALEVEQDVFRMLDGGPKFEKRITYCGQAARIGCDGNCGKAWGSNSRPKVQLSDDEDDYAYKSDAELGPAPVNPDSYEGGYGKPKGVMIADDMNRWCARECERCVITEPGKPNAPLELRDFSRRRYNKPPHQRTVHILRLGLALCEKFFGRPPDQWPADHLWVRLEDEASADCKGCIDVLVRRGRAANRDSGGS